MLSAKCKYGLKAIAHIARYGTKGPVLIADIAEAQNIPKKFLDVILLELKMSGMLASKKGKGGGYQMARPASKIAIAEIVRVLDGPLGPLPCANGERPCEDCASGCGICSVMTDVHDAMAAILENTSVADLTRRSAQQPERVLMFDI